MDAYRKLDLHKSDDDIHLALRNFEVKWQKKAGRLSGDGRISRF